MKRRIYNQKLNLRNKLHKICFRDGEDLQEYLTKLEEIVLELPRLNDWIAEKDKTGVLLRYLSD